MTVTINQTLLIILTSIPVIILIYTAGYFILKKFSQSPDGIHPDEFPERVALGFMFVASPVVIILFIVLTIFGFIGKLFVEKNK